MKSIKALLVGMPGKLASVIGKGILASGALELLDFSFCSPSCDTQEGDTQEAGTQKALIGGSVIKLIRPQDWDRVLDKLDNLQEIIVLDCTTPTSVVDNVRFYRNKQLNFILATSGYNRADIDAILASEPGSWQANALLAPNLAKPIVLLQALLEYGATRFPGALSDLEMQITESHQSSKRDVSGTALWMLERFNKLGINIKPGTQINSVREPKLQEQLGVPEEFISGHAWHSYKFKTKHAAGGSNASAFSATLEHNINGRDLYAAGAISAAKFLFSKVLAGSRGEIFSMIDVLENERLHEDN